MSRPILSVLTLALLSAVSSLATPAFAAETNLTFEGDVRPILKVHCFLCHGEFEKPEGGLDLRLVRLMTKGGDSGTAIEPGKHDVSLLYQRLKAEEMPPGDKKKLSRDELATIARWIDQGARTARPEPAEVAAAAEVTEEEKSFWSFQPIRRPDVPKVGDPTNVRTPIDAFLLTELEKQKLGFSPEADKRTLIRRVYFDLIGLPPTIEEVDLFLADDSTDAYDRLIDRLLASPHYGERWGRHWLDVAGYADSDGYSEKDLERKYAHKYRDYVIRAFNSDKPFDQFIQEQLAGDEMVKPPYNNLQPQDIERLVATGFLRMGPDGTGDPTGDQNLARNEVMAETIKIVSTSFLGLSVGCAQCHSHRYDPIPQTDYYRLRAVFEPAYDWKNWRSPQGRLVSLFTDADRKKAAEVDAELKLVTDERKAKVDVLINETFERELAKLPEEIREPIRDARNTPVAKQTSEQKKLLKENPSVNVTAGSLYLYDRKAADTFNKEYDARLAEIRARRPVEDYVQALTEVPGKVPATVLFFRGDINSPRQTVPPGELTVVCSTANVTIPEKDPGLSTTGRRLAYARHLTDGKHPLTARVLVNRVWMHHFGRGIVGTPSDFGFLGERPTHPELLDWLASDFMAGGWHIKRLHKLLMTSTAYRQSSRRTDALDAVDPENRLLGRMSVRRLEAETIRDAVLATSGKLSVKMFGAAVPVMPDDVGQVVLGVDTRDGAGRPSSKFVALGEDEFRRSIYVQVRRSLPLGMLEVFDAPTLSPNCEIRSNSTVAPQSLLLMNNSFIVQQSELFADRVQKLAGSDVAAQVKLSWKLALVDEPTETQIEEGVAFLDEQAKNFVANKSKMPPVDPKKPGVPYDPQRLALASLCQALLSGNSFLYVD
jgi:hypothetical protein